MNRKMYSNIVSVFGFFAQLFSKYAQRKVLQFLRHIEYGRLKIVIAYKDGDGPSSFSFGEDENSSEREVTLTVTHQKFWTRVFWNMDTVSIIHVLALTLDVGYPTLSTADILAPGSCGGIHAT